MRNPPTIFLSIFRAALFCAHFKPRGKSMLILNIMPLYMNSYEFQAQV